ncbi:beta-glucosidase family protein [Aphanothece minutissima]|uniref:Glycosyl hydrolase n=1 Tax=Aphanothece cf. minutissima CCALA 015 TaxID=2107695 RepID=A0ABX5F4N9_9CHRO|nr:glycoside hydrolase family 3 C-terminal domain-containing protein [Aphanothece minutissima]PSB36355.1 glycosyl hydrolase [Aphanothece cf. minutissima CCALA 015]
MPTCPDWSRLETQARTQLQRLSLGEKLAMLDGDTPFWGGLAAIAFHDAAHRRPWPAGVVERLGIDGLHFVDGPRGVVLEGGATTFPAPIGRGASWDVDLEERIGEAMGAEARSFGANLFGGICVNLLRHPGWGRAQETYGEDPVHVGAMGAAATRGVRRHAIACLKHFALNSIDSARFRVDVSAGERVLQELYLPQFRDGVEAGALAVMSAYNSVNGAWCGQHPHLLREILKDRWGFRGFVLTDFIFGLRDGVAALQAGQDLEMPFRMIFAATLPEAVAAGRVPETLIDAAVLRMLLAQATIPTGAYPVTLRGCRAHRQLARAAAAGSIVLLRNDGDVLPLKGIASLAVIGPLADTVNLGDRGSSDTRPTPGSVLTPLAGLRAAAPELCLHHDHGGDPARAAALAARSEAALVVVGLDWRHEGEHIHPGDLAPILRQAPPPAWLLRLCGRRRLLPIWTAVAAMVAGVTRFGTARAGGSFASGDRTVLELPPAQEALILAVAAANPRTVVVLMGGGAILCEAWRQRVPGLLLLWYPGEQGGAALADVLLGRISPSGRMPFSVPTEAGHLPPFDPRARHITYDLWHGYRRLARSKQPAAFPFGFGLSYSCFSHTDPELAWLPTPAGDEGAVELAVTVTNTGTVEAAEVVQVYLEPPGEAVERPRRTLVGFARVCLAADASRRVAVEIPLRRLAWFDQGRDAFMLESGRHRLLVARHAEDGGIGVDLVLVGGVVGR